MKKENKQATFCKTCSETIDTENLLDFRLHSGLRLGDATHEDLDREIEIIERHVRLSEDILRHLEQKLGKPPQPRQGP